MQERRSCKREHIVNPLQFRRKLFSAKADSFSRDLSLTGICFFSEQRLIIGRLVRLNLYNQPRIHKKTISAKIVWSEEFEDKLGRGYFNGAKFVG